MIAGKDFSIADSPERKAIPSHWDVVVIGAGPAGTLAALKLARAGVQTLLLEKSTFPRYKVCGACLNPWSLDVLQANGLDEILSDGIPLNRLVIGSGGKQATINLPGSVALSRAAMDARLAKLAKNAGARIEFGSKAEVLPDTSKTVANAVTNTATTKLPERQVRVTFANGETETFQTRIVIAADGLNHPSLKNLVEFQTEVSLRSRVGAGTTIDQFPDAYKSGAITMATGPGGYAGLTFVEDGRLNIAAAFDAALLSKHKNAGLATAELLASAGFPQIEGLSNARWIGTPTLTRRTTPLASRGIYLAGDAAGYVEPFTGEGMAWAFASAHELAPIVQDALAAPQKNFEQLWATRWEVAVGKHAKWCRRLAWLLKKPTMTHLATRLLTHYSKAGDRLVSQLQFQHRTVLTHDPHELIASGTHSRTTP